MGQGRRIDGQGHADTTSYRPVLVYPPMLKHGVGTLRVTHGLYNLEGSYTQAVYYRFLKALPDTPNAGGWTSTANTRNTNGEATVDIDVSATTDQMWVQVALMGKSGGAMAGGLSSLLCQTSGRSRVLADVTLPISATADAWYLPVGAPFACMDLQSLMFAAIVYGTEGTTVGFRPMWRTFGARLDEPGDWAMLDSQQSVSAKTEYNSGSEAVSPGTSQWAQAGMKISGSSTRGSMRVIAAGLF